MKQFISMAFFSCFFSIIALSEDAEPAFNIVEASRLAQSALEATWMKDTHLIFTLTCLGVPGKEHWIASVATKDRTVKSDPKKMIMIYVYRDKTTAIKEMDVIEPKEGQPTRRRVIIPSSKSGSSDKPEKSVFEE